MRAKAIKNYDHYEKRVYVDETPWHLYRRGTAATLELADEFYVRPATSSRGPAWRIIVPRLGPTYVFSLDGPNAPGEYDFLMSKSQEWGKE